MGVNYGTREKVAELMIQKMEDTGIDANQAFEEVWADYPPAVHYGDCLECGRNFARRDMYFRPFSGGIKRDNTTLSRICVFCEMGIDRLPNPLTENIGFSTWMPPPKPVNKGGRPKKEKRSKEPKTTTEPFLGKSGVYWDSQAARFSEIFETQLSPDWVKSFVVDRGAECYLDECTKPFHAIVKDDRYPDDIRMRLVCLDHTKHVLGKINYHKKFGKSTNPETGFEGV